MSKADVNVIRWTGVGVAAIFLILIVIIGIRLNDKETDKREGRELIENYKTSRQMIFAETIDGTMLYVPLLNNEGIIELSGDDGKKGVIYFTQIGETVSLSDDILVNKQPNLYEMLLSIIDEATKTDKTTTDTGIEYNYYITDTKTIMNLLTEKWGLTEGQTIGSLSVYDATSADKVRMQLSIAEKNNKMLFLIGISVKDKNYLIYKGNTFGSGPNEFLPQTLYTYKAYQGMSTTSEDVQEYLSNVKDFLYDLSSKLEINIEQE